jgi:hypothetical protein
MVIPCLRILHRRQGGLHCHVLCPIPAYLCTQRVVPFFHKGVINLESAGVIDLEEIEVEGSRWGRGESCDGNALSVVSGGL